MEQPLVGQPSPDFAPRASHGFISCPAGGSDDAPTPRILVVGAQSGDGDPRKLEWIRHIYPKLDLAMSVCVGAFVLGNAGLLDGQAATTNANVYDDFEKKFPKTKLVRGVRFVESGKVATATGLTAGIDLALRVTDRFYGREAATKIAKYEEWKSTAWQADA
jgi:transcriptional regulator GlxA family with amidase domain